MFCRKKLIHQFHTLREKFRDFWQETRITLSSFHNSTQRVERVWQNFPRNFFQFSAGSPNWALALRSKFSSKKTFLEKINYFYRFRTLTELHLRVRRKVLFRKTVLEFLLSVHDFEPNSFGFGKILRFFFRNCPLRHHKNF